MEVLSEESLNNIVNKIALKCNLTNWIYSHETFESIAQNYFGVVVPIVLTGEDNKKEITLKIVLKIVPADQLYRMSGAVTAMFTREIFIYTVVLQKYIEIQNKFKFSTQLIIPRCFDVSSEYGKEYLAIENMCAKGYQPFTKRTFLNLEQITLSIKSLAILHALSFILNAVDPQKYSEIKEVCVPLTEENNKRYIDIMRDRLNKAVNKLDGTNYVNLLTHLNKNIANYFLKAVESVSCTCICHGDIWKENILFKNEDLVPVSVCLIDYQTSRISCPAFDTLYLIITSTDTELRQKHYHQLMDTYYQTFNQILSEAGLESQILYSKEMLDHDLKIVWPACLITANTALWLSNGLQEEGHVRSKIVWETPEQKEHATNKYKSIIVDIIDDFCKFNYLNLNDCNSWSIE